MLFYTFLCLALCSRNNKYSVNHLFLLLSSLHIFVHHCTFCASLHTKTSPGIACTLFTANPGSLARATYLKILNILQLDNVFLKAVRLMTMIIESYHQRER